MRLTRHRPLWSLEHRSQDAAVLPGRPVSMSCCRCAAPCAAAPLPAVGPRCCRQGVLQPIILRAMDGACVPRSMLHSSWKPALLLDQLCVVCQLPSSKLTTWCVSLTALTAGKAQSIEVPALVQITLRNTDHTHVQKVVFDARCCGLAHGLKVATAVIRQFVDDCHRSIRT
jgi:hypothetical protein